MVEARAHPANYVDLSKCVAAAAAAAVAAAVAVAVAVAVFFMFFNPF